MGKEAFTETKNIQVRIYTIDGHCNAGFLNILGYDRLSDYLQKHSSDFITLYNNIEGRDLTVFFAKKNIIRIEEAQKL
jgi:hypothetical protein